MTRDKLPNPVRIRNLIDQNGIYARLLRIQGQKHVPSVEQFSVEARLTQENDQPARKLADFLPPLKGHHPRWLTPDMAVIHLGNLGALHVTVKDEAIYGGVFAVRCLPVHFPRRYISLRYLDSEKHEVEVGLIRDLDQWPAPAQKLVGESLTEAIFSPYHHRRSSSIEVFSGYLNFDVETDLGPLQFMMRWQGDRAYNYGHGGKLLIDTDENRYLIPDVQKLTESERRLFLRYIYW